VRNKTSFLRFQADLFSLYVRHDILLHELGGKRVDLAI
jgi:hypothetical protein